MNDHLSDRTVTMFQARTLPITEMMAALDHLAQCRQCRQRSHEHFQVTNKYEASTITLSPALHWQYDHLEAETVEAFVQKSLDREDEAIAQAHLQTCANCRAEIQSLRAFQTELATELQHRYGPKSTVEQAWKWSWPSWNWKPIFATTIAAACLFVTVFVISRQDHQQPNTPIVIALPSPTTSILFPSPSASPAASPTPAKVGAEEQRIASLQDQTRTIALTSKGELEGLPQVADQLRGDITAALRTGRLSKPVILTDLANETEIVRGNAAQAAPKKLISPVGITVLSDRPVLHWQAVAKATGYEIQIADGRGNLVAQSEILTAMTKSWQSSTALKRGTIYTWTVRPIYDESTTTTPFSSGRFKVLEAAQVTELARLKNQTNSRLILGMFYARVGMLPEARRELKLLANQNPDSALAHKLLRSVQSWH